VYEVDLLREYKTAKYLSKVPTMTGWVTYYYQCVLSALQLTNGTFLKINCNKQKYFFS
jgi:hypothetical protein